MVRVLTLLPVVFFCFHSFASVPEPSFIVFGVVESAGTQIRNEGVVVSASYSGDIVSEFTLDASTNYRYSLEIPIEADVGARSSSSVRVGDVLGLSVSGQLVSNLIVSDRGVSVEVDLSMPVGFDSDGDGISDSDEVASGTDPENPNDPVLYGSGDLDGDGIPNGQEYYTGTYDPESDYDGDGYSNTDEYLLASSPADDTDFPAQYAPFGKYASIDTQEGAYIFPTIEDGSELIWDAALYGLAKSILPIMWDDDELFDLMISTSGGQVFVMVQVADLVFKTPSAINLFSLPVSGDVLVGFANFDGVASEELWAYSRTTETVYVYERSPTGQPFGDDLWFSIQVSGIAGMLDIADVSGDGVPDLIATGVDLLLDNMQPENTVALMKGGWDGINFNFQEPQLHTANSLISNSHVRVVPNIKEAGYDSDVDIMLRGEDKYHYLNLSYNSYSKFDDMQPTISEYLNGQVSLIPAGDSFYSGSHLDPYVYGSFFGNDEYTDVLLHDGESGLFVFARGVMYDLDSDGDGIPDYRDPDMFDSDIPLPNGELDYDGDGIPYAADGSHSGSEDADGDGMNDSFELTHALNPMDATDANSDNDNDGVSAYLEYVDGTDPNDNSSVISSQATVVASAAVFDSGASDLVVFGDDIVASSVNSKSVKVLSGRKVAENRTLEVSDGNGVSKLLRIDSMLAVGTVGGVVEVWDYSASRRLITFDRSNSSVTDMASDGVNLYTLHSDGSIFHWNLQSLTYVNSWKVYDGILTSMYVKGDFLYIQSSSPERILFVWDVANNRAIYSVTGSGKCCMQVISEKVGSELLVANSFSGQGIYALDLNNFTTRNLVSDIDVSSMKSTGAEIYVGRRSGVIDWYDSSSGGFIGRVAAPNQFVRKIDLIEGGFISLHSDGKLYYWEHK
jgi:hypothetical protein